MCGIGLFLQRIAASSTSTSSSPVVTTGPLPVIEYLDGCAFDVGHLISELQKRGPDAMDHLTLTLEAPPTASPQGLHQQPQHLLK